MTQEPASAGEPPGMMASMRIMHELLRGQCAPEEAARRLGAPLERVQVYARFVRDHVQAALDKNYEVLAEAVGPARWQRWSDAFFQAHPPGHYELNACAAPFPDFLAERAADPAFEVADWHVELARLQWCEWEAYAHETRIPAPEELEAPVLNPTLAILGLSHPVATFTGAWRRWVRDDRAGPAPEAPAGPAEETAFVYRHPDTLLHTTRVADEPLLFAFKVVHDGLPVAGAAATAGISADQARELLADAEETGLIVQPASLR